MKIHVVGSCQAIPLAQCIAAMLPDVRVERYASNVEASSMAMEAGDVVFRQRRRTVAWSASDHPGEFVFPRIWFNAFHPDAVYVTGPAGAVPFPLAYQSSIALYAWHRGLSVPDTARLFCEPVFEHLNFFRYWTPAMLGLLDEGRRVEFPLGPMTARWERSGRFMHSPNHPALNVMADIARELLQRAGIAPSFSLPEHVLNDVMLDHDVWPVYPELGRRLGVPGEYAFKQHRAPNSANPALLLGLEEYIARCFAAYAHMPASALACARLEGPAYRDLESVAARAQRAAPMDGSPYAALPASQFWRRAVERAPAAEVDPVGDSPFCVDRRARVATIGSCFAQNMSRVLAREGYTYFVAERAPEELSPDVARAAGYGVFSARSGNVYTARQLLQLFQRAFGTFAPGEDAWQRPDGRYADPFRPLIEPDGFVTADDVRASRARHLAAVRTMFEQLDVLIFTLGLTEAWRSRADGAVFPLAPGVSAGTMDSARYEFVNFTTAEVRDDLGAFLRSLEDVNPRARVVLTVSPQPPIATYEPRHVVVSSTYTKAALRAAADEVQRAHPHVWYFPGYEVVAGTHSRGAYYEPDLRTVTAAGVERVMQLFLRHAGDGAPRASELGALLLAENRANAGVDCDEEAIALEQYEPMRGLGNGVASSAVMEPLPPAAMRARIDAVLPRSMVTRAVVDVACTVRNTGDAVLVTGGKHPIFLCYRWFGEDGRPTDLGDAIHTPLPAPLHPGETVTVQMAIAGPRFAGRYRLHVTLLQSDVAWFDDVDPGNGVHAVVDAARARAGPAV